MKKLLYIPAIFFFLVTLADLVVSYTTTSDGTKALYIIYCLISGILGATLWTAASYYQ